MAWQEQPAQIISALLQIMSNSPADAWFKEHGLNVNRSQAQLAQEKLRMQEARQPKADKPASYLPDLIAQARSCRPKPQCQEQCPLCGMSCLKEAEHDSSAHDSCHQPLGMEGIVCRDGSTTRLSGLTCNKAVDRQVRVTYSIV